MTDAVRLAEHVRRFPDYEPSTPDIRLLAAEVLRLREALRLEHDALYRIAARATVMTPERIRELATESMEQANAALASSPLEERSSSESKESVDSSDDSETTEARPCGACMEDGVVEGYTCAACGGTGYEP